MDKPSQTADRQIARAAGTVMIAFVLSNLMGLIKWILVSKAFGTSAELDAFNAANRVPDLLFNLMAGGALASAFIPTFTSILTKGDLRGAWRLASAIANLLFIVLSLAAALCWLGAPWLVSHILAPGFDPQQAALTVSLLRILLPSAVVFGVSGLLMGVLNAHQHFLLPALAPSFLWLGWIAGVLILTPRLGIHGLAYGVLLGAAMHLAVQLPGLARQNARYHPTLALRDAHVRQVGRLMAPRVLGAGVVQLNFLVNTILASAQPEGSLTGITVAAALMLSPQAIIAQAIAIAAFPTFSAQAARGELQAMRASLANTLRGVVFLALPTSLTLIILRRPLIGLLFQRGAFDAQSTSQVSWALLWYAAGLVGHAVLEITARAFFALKDTRTPVVVGVVAMSLNALFSLGFSSLFASFGWMPHGGLALANSLATALECAALLWLMRRRLGGLDMARIRPGFLATTGASAMMALAMTIWMLVMREGTFWLQGLGGSALGAAVYWLSSLALRAPEARELPRLLLRRHQSPKE